MKRSFILLISVLLLSGLPSCTEDCHLDLIVITGMDYRECACCGGFMINFSNNPEPYGDEFKLTQELPPGSGITYETEFPVYAWIKWQPLEQPCEFIEVLHIRKL